MRPGFLIPTAGEAANLPSSADYICAGYGAGKAAACAAAADLIFERRCDTIIIWGTAGGISPRATSGHGFVADRVAYSDYDLRPLTGVTGVGFVPGLTDDDGWLSLPPDLAANTECAVREVYPELKFDRGSICSSDKFLLPSDRRDYNRIEATADAIDMESAAVAEFCRKLNRRCGKKIELSVIRIVSNSTSVPESGHAFENFLDFFCSLNSRLPRLKQAIEDYSSRH